MSKELSREEFEQRHAELEEAERLAEDAYKSAAFAEATETGTDAETAKAKKHLEGIRTKRETLTVAFKASETEHQKRKNAAGKEAHAGLVKAIEADLAERREMVEAVIEHADGLGAAINRYYDLNDKIRRAWHGYVTKHTKVTAVRAMEGIAESIEGGHHMGVLAGHILQKNHKISSTLISGGLGSMRGNGPLEVEDGIADRVKRRVVALAPRGDD